MIRLTAVCLLALALAAPASAGPSGNREADWLYIPTIIGWAYDKLTRPGYCDEIDKRLEEWRRHLAVNWEQMTEEQRRAARFLYRGVRRSNPDCYKGKPHAP